MWFGVGERAKPEKNGKNAGKSGKSTEDIGISIDKSPVKAECGGRYICRNPHKQGRFPYTTAQEEGEIRGARGPGMGSSIHPRMATKLQVYLEPEL
jgi:hypothetical protein